MTSRKSSLWLKLATFICFAFTPLLNPLVRHWKKVSPLATTMLVTAILLGIGLVGHSSAADQPALSNQRSVTANVTTPVKSSSPDSVSSKTPLWWDGRIIPSRKRVAGRKKVKRTRAEIVREQKELLARTNREIDAIVATGSMVPPKPSG